MGSMVKSAFLSEHAPAVFVTYIVKYSCKIPLTMGLTSTQHLLRQSLLWWHKYCITHLRIKPLWLLRKEILQPQACHWESPMRQFWQMEMCSSKVPTKPHSGITWWCWVLIPPNVYNTRSLLQTYSVIFYIHSLLERKATILKPKMDESDCGLISRLYRLYNGSFFLNILDSSGLGKKIKLIPSPLHHLPLS